MAGAAELPGLPLDNAAQTLLQANPVLGAVLIFEAAAICALAWFIVSLIRDKDKVLAAKDKEIAEAKASHMADLRLNVPALADLKEGLASVQKGLLDVATSNRRRT